MGPLLQQGIDINIFNTITSCKAAMATCTVLRRGEHAMG